MESASTCADSWSSDAASRSTVSAWTSGAAVTTPVTVGRPWVRVPVLSKRTTRPAAKPAAEEPTPGATRTETGARGQGFGLSTGGSGGSGVQLEVGDFCCPDYLQQMGSLIQQNWQSKQGVAGATIMRFTITRRGSIEGVQVFQTSGFVALDLAAQQALLRTRLPELPPQYPNQTLTMRVTFDYSR